MVQGCFREVDSNILDVGGLGCDGVQGPGFGV